MVVIKIYVVPKHMVIKYVLVMVRMRKRGEMAFNLVKDLDTEFREAREKEYGLVKDLDMEFREAMVMTYDLVKDLRMKLREAKGHGCLCRSPLVNGCPILFNQSQNLVMNFLTLKIQRANLHWNGVRNTKR